MTGAMTNEHNRLGHLTLGLHSQPLLCTWVMVHMIIVEKPSDNNKTKTVAFHVVLVHQMKKERTDVQILFVCVAIDCMHQVCDSDATVTQVS